MMDLNKIRKMEDHPVEYWRSECLAWWKLYFRNAKIIRELRKQNRGLRQLLADMHSDD